MSTSAPGAWRLLGEAISERYARSSWRLVALVLVGFWAPLALLYLVRGIRGVVLGVAAYGAAGVFTLSYARPFEALVAALFIAYSGLDLYLPGPVAWGLLLIAAARAVFDALAGRALDWGTPAFRVSTTLLLAIAFTSLIMARTLEAASGRLFNIGVGILLLIAISAYANQARRLRILVTTLGLAFGLNVLVMLLEVARSGGMSLLTSPTEATRLGIGDVNKTSVLACCLILLVVQQVGHTRGWVRLALAAVLPLGVVSIVLSVSRMGMILLAITIGALVLQARRARPFLLAGIVGLVVLLYKLPADYWTRFISLLQFRGIIVDRSLQLRQHALEAGWQIFVEHPWLGVGLGNFHSESPRYMSVALWAHNTYVDAAATMGLFGFLAFVAWQLSGLGMVGRSARLWRVAGREHDRALAISIGFALLLIYLAAVTLDYVFHIDLWLFLALANAARLCAETGNE
jgi:O-antigen ligase